MCLNCRDSVESMKQGGYGMAQDLQLITGHWGFEPSEIPPLYHGPWHIFQGSEDWLVSPSLQRLIKKEVGFHLILLKHLFSLAEAQGASVYSRQWKELAICCLV